MAVHSSVPGLEGPLVPATKTGFRSSHLQFAFALSAAQPIQEAGTCDVSGATMCDYRIVAILEQTGMLEALRLGT
jgi:hypothetical protein